MTKHTRDTFLVVTISIIVLIILFITRKKELHEYATDPPTEQGYYLTYIKIIKTAGKETAEEIRWEVLYFYPNSNFPSDWNTLHLGDWEVEVLYWTELPPEPQL